MNSATQRTSTFKMCASSVLIAAGLGSTWISLDSVSLSDRPVAYVLALIAGSLVSVVGIFGARSAVMRTTSRWVGWGLIGDGLVMLIIGIVFYALPSVAGPDPESAPYLLISAALWLAAGVLALPRAFSQRTQTD